MKEKVTRPGVTSDMQTFWDSRYNTDHFVYGKEPNGFFAFQIDKLETGKILLPGDGEGRNAVYAAMKGWEVEAFDQSIIGSEKATEFAREEGVHINYHVCDLKDFAFERDSYDAIGLTFFHAPPQVRIFLHSQVVKSLKPGGTVILEAFHISQIDRNSGGPKSPEMLFDRTIILEDFGELQTQHIEELQVNLEEGSFHRGEASVIRYTGTKNL